MTYRKPEVQNLGDAASAIQIFGKPNGTQIDFFDGTRGFNPAYDFDE